MGYLSVVEVKEEITSRKGAGWVCNYCGAPIIAYEMDVSVSCCHCFPIPIPSRAKTKTKLYCPLCSLRYLPPPPHPRR